MGPYYDTANIHAFTRTPDDVRLLEGRHLDMDEPVGDNASMIFGAVMMVLAIAAYSIDSSETGPEETPTIELAHHADQ